MKTLQESSFARAKLYAFHGPDSHPLHRLNLPFRIRHKYRSKRPVNRHSLPRSRHAPKNHEEAKGDGEHDGESGPICIDGIFRCDRECEIVRE